MSTYKLISWGANSHGQLGQGTRSEQCMLPQEVNLSGCELRPEAVRKIVGGGGHTLILDADGRVYSCGRNDRGQAGVADTERRNLLTFQRLQLRNGDTAVDVCCGWDSSAALTRDGDLYLWGSNRYGQLGDDPSLCSSLSSPVRYVLASGIRRASMGLRHTVALTTSGDVLVCGANNKEQLGLVKPGTEPSRDTLNRFAAVPGLTDAEDVACGEYYTIVSTMSSRKDTCTIHFFGDNKRGQAGLDPQACRRVCPPRAVDVDPHLVAPIHIHAGWSHASILNDGNIYSWGRNSYGQLGRGTIEEETSWRIRRVENLPKVIQLSVGSEHNVALTEAGDIFCWGWNEHGNCGNGDTKDVLAPERLAIPPNTAGILVGAGAGYSFAVIKTVN